MDAPNANLLETIAAANAVGVGMDLPQLQTKLPDSTSSNSDTEVEGEVAENAAVVEGDGLGGGTGRAGSPPPNCAICLGRCKNKCFTDSCIHQFCFKCLCEWSKVKPECPLCKQTFKSIIHNVKSMDQFERYHVQPPTVQIPQSQNSAYEQLPYIVDGVFVNGRNDYEISVANWNGPRAPDRIVRPRRNAYSVFPFAVGASGSAGSRNAVAEGGENLLFYSSDLLDMYIREYPDAAVSSEILSQRWRRYVYDRKFYALPVRDITGRFRDSSARFYRNNPAQIHRLVPFINRDIECLLRNTEHDLPLVLESIKDSLPLCNILSPAFRRRLQPFLGNRTAHFIHELHNFARSPYDMMGYDRAVQFSTRMTEEIVIEFTTSGSSDEEIANEMEGAPERTRTRDTQVAPSIGDYRVQSRAAGSNGVTQSPMVNLLAFTISTTSEGTEAPGVSVESGGRVVQSTAINLTTHNRANEVIIELDENDLDVTVGARSSVTVASVPSTSTSAMQTTQQQQQQQPQQQSIQPVTTNITENIELTSSSSDECEFVLERKPPHLRTPEMVSLNSESDSDVVFVTETKPRKPTTFGSNEDEAAPGPSKKPQPAADANLVNVKNEQELYNVGASTSAYVQSVRRRPREKQLASAQKQQRRKRSHGSGEVRCKAKRSRQSEITTSSPSSSPSDSDSNFDVKKPVWKLKSNRKILTAKKATHRRTTRGSKRGLGDGDKSPTATSTAKRRQLSAKEIQSDDTSDEDESLSLKILKYRLAHAPPEFTHESSSSDEEFEHPNPALTETPASHSHDQLLEDEQPSCSKAAANAVRPKNSSTLVQEATEVVNSDAILERSAPSRVSSIESLREKILKYRLVHAPPEFTNDSSGSDEEFEPPNPALTETPRSHSHDQLLEDEQPSCSKVAADAGQAQNSSTVGEETTTVGIMVNSAAISERSAPSRASSIDSMSSATSSTSTSTSSSSLHSSTSAEESDFNDANANSLFTTNLTFIGPSDAAEPWYVSLVPPMPNNVDSISTQDSLPSQSVVAAGSVETDNDNEIAGLVDELPDAATGLDLSAYPSLDMRIYSDDASSETMTEQNDL